MDRAKLVQSSLKFISTGSTLLDLALGGGWVQGRVFNIVGDKSSGKTLLAIEAFANFNRTHPTGHMRYAEAEAAFDEDYAATLGFPNTVAKPEKQLETVEEFESDLYKFLKLDGPKIYILDSLDALSDDAEMKKFTKAQERKTQPESEADEGGTTKGSYGMAKAKRMSELFRLMVKAVKREDCILGIISQIRDRVDVSFGESKTRSGGHALDFYATHVLWLSEIEKLTREIRTKKHIYGINVLGNVKKNKVKNPFKKVEFPIIFNYGVDDEISMLDYLSSMKELAPEQVKEFKGQLSRARKEQDYSYVFTNVTNPLREKTRAVWNDIEQALAPPMRKYAAPQRQD